MGASSSCRATAGRSPAQAGLVAGRLTVNPAGFGFCQPDDPALEDVHVPARSLGSAMHGDRVLVHVGRGRGERPRGRVVRVLAGRGVHPPGPVSSNRCARSPGCSRGPRRAASSPPGSEPGRGSRRVPPTELRTLFRDWPFFRALVENLEMSLAKSSMGIAEGYLELVGDDALAARVFGVLRDEHDRARDAVLEIVEARELLDRHPVLQQSIRLRNPYVDPMNAIQVELLKRWRAGDESALRPLLRSIAGIAAALRNTGLSVRQRPARRSCPRGSGGTARGRSARRRGAPSSPPA